MYVELDRIRSQLDRPQEGGQGVFRERLMRTAVRDLFRVISARWFQASPSVVALGTVREAMNVILPGQLLLTRAGLGRLPDEAP